MPVEFCKAVVYLRFALLYLHGNLFCICDAHPSPNLFQVYLHLCIGMTAVLAQ